MKYIKANRYDADFIRENMMGPNPLKLLEQLLKAHPLLPTDTVLDFGCGQGITSIFAAKEYGSMVFAADLWIAPTDNKKRFDEMGLTPARIVPISVEAHNLPFAQEFFDKVICVDAYHYFGLEREYLGEHLLPIVKHGGTVLIAVPGMKKDIHDNIPQEMRKSWSAEDLNTIHDMSYWRRIIEAAGEAEIVSIREMEDAEECWNDWLKSDNEYAVNDRKAMNAGAGKYMNFISIVLRRK